MMEHCPVYDKKYTLKQIKVAFYKQFHKSGEHWFPYPDMGASEEECNNNTLISWKEFRKKLNDDSNS